jgi:predicted RNA-binding Zn-ribbon protein involved in translation (DUF1610 family)
MVMKKEKQLTQRCRSCGHLLPRRGRVVKGRLCCQNCGTWNVVILNGK